LRAGTALALQLGMLVLPLLAVLATEPAPFEAHKLGVQLPLGIGMPTGLLGAVLDWTPIPALSIEGGIGVDRSFGILGDSGGFQWSIMPRLRLVPVPGVGLSVGLGVSGGSYEWCDSCPFENGDRWDWKQALWLNAEFGAEYRWMNGMGLRAVVGAASLMNSADVSCLDTKYGCLDTPPASQSAQTYFGLALRIPLTE
jgi:hypothetical protein